ncbi:MAG: hypothetical protein KAJ12_04165 [Bacteroidetes bacterium]|nr:hypothetical protein [Bacteroidota bacterium]
MKQLIVLLSVSALLGLFAACGSGDNQGEKQNDRTARANQDAEGHAHDTEGHMETDEKKDLPSSDAWVREGPIDVEALDLNRDGFVYQDPMDWNVIADEEGRCPKCGMLLEKVSVAEATGNLRKFGFEVVGADYPEGTNE